MMHAPAHLLIEFADDALIPSARDQVRRHLSDCSSCAAALFELKSTRSSLAHLLAELDEAEPAAWTPAVQAIYASTPAAEKTASVGRIWRWAAGIALLSGAAAAGAAILRQATRPVPDAPPAAAATTNVPAALAPSGVLVLPENNAAQIELADIADGSRINIVVNSEAMIGVHALNADAPEFVARNGHVLVRLHNRAALLRVTVPAALGMVRIVADGQTIGVIEAGQLRSVTPDARIALELEGR